MKLTRYERRGLVGGHNLSDGHARHEFAPYSGVLTQLPALFDASDRDNVGAVEERFEYAFFHHAGQHSYQQLPPPLYNFACSLSIEVVANYLRAQHLSVALIHPTFDNLADILRRNGVSLVPLEQDWLTGDEGLAPVPDTDAIFLVCPNNPTGQNLTQHEFSRVVDHCASRRKLLIIDFSFRFFSDFTAWDQYDLLRESGVDFIALEDTGKTLPTLDLKVGLTVTNDRLYPGLLAINEDMVLNVSPFTLKLLTACIDVDVAAGREHARLAIGSTRQLLRQLIQPTPVRIYNPASVISVEWLQLPPGWVAEELCEWLAGHEVHVLPGMPFFWANHSRGQSFIRVSLSRPLDTFIESARRLTDLLTSYQRPAGTIASTSEVMVTSLPAGATKQPLTARVGPAPLS